MEKLMSRKIRMGIVGGGIGAFIGVVHRMAAMMDNEIELVCGAFSSNPERSKASGEAWHVPAERVYGSYQDMMKKEQQLPEDQRMDFVCIVTPNHLHFPVAKAALEHGFHVMSDKPMTFDVAEARELVALVEKTGLVFGLTHNYTGYPMVKQARDFVKSGKIGKVRKVVVEYPQGWLASRLEESGQKQADWRTDPKRSGATCCLGDIGTHAENLAEYITDLEIDEVCAEFTTFVEGRQLEDDANVLVRYKGGAKGILFASQISIGEENDLNIRVYGEKGALRWRQEEPNTLLVKYADRPTEVYRAGVNYGDRLCEAATAASRIPAGHPEGYLEAFANLYRNFANVLQKKLAGETPTEIETDFPNVHDGLRGMLFVDTCVESAGKGGVWTKMKQ